MSSACMMQTNYAKANQYQYNNMMILQQPSAAPTTTKILGNSNLQNIQPAASGVGSTIAKRKYTYANMPYGEQLPSVARRNARERNRVKQVNNGFANLRQHLPQSVINSLSNGGRGASKKLSKVDTLRIAVEYIRGLSDMLDSTGSTKHHETSNEHFDFDLDSPCSENETQYQSQTFNSEASASPAPSYSGSDISNGGANYFQPLKLESEPLQFKFEPFDNYNSFSQEEQPDDEELLDYISSWQEQ